MNQRKRPSKQSIKTKNSSIKVAGAAGAETGSYAPLIGMAVGKAVGDKLDKMDAKRNSRNRKIKFFLDKMKEEGEQQDRFILRI